MSGYFCLSNKASEILKAPHCSHIIPWWLVGHPPLSQVEAPVPKIFVNPIKYIYIYIYIVISPRNHSYPRFISRCQHAQCGWKPWCSDHHSPLTPWNKKYARSTTASFSARGETIEQALWNDAPLLSMGDLQDPKMEVLYHMFGHILWGYSLT